MVDQRLIAIRPNMLLEALNFAATYVISPRKHAGEINASVKLWARARRCARDWAEHEENCKTFVSKLLDGIEDRRIAVVLGSGLLRDVPVELLCRTFREVWLYDLQHLASVRLWAAAKGLRNLHFINRDLSGLDRGPPMAFLGENPEIDHVISANLLSQIGVALTREIDSAARIASLLQSHVDGLAAFPAATCLLTDTAYDIVGRDGRALERRDLLPDVVLPEAQATWTWTVAPFGELDPVYKAVHRVIAATC